MVTFEIDGKEYELKLTYKSLKYSNGLFEGASYELIGKAIQGDLESFPKIGHAALLHTDEHYASATVEEQIEELVDSGKLSLDQIARICDEVVAQSVFYKATIEKLMKSNPEMKKALDQLRG